MNKTPQANQKASAPETRKTAQAFRQTVKGGGDKRMNRNEFKKHLNSLSQPAEPKVCFECGHECTPAAPQPAKAAQRKSETRKYIDGGAVLPLKYESDTIGAGKIRVTDARNNLVRNFNSIQLAKEFVECRNTGRIYEPSKLTLAAIRGERHHDMPEQPATPQPANDPARLSVPSR